MGQGPLGPNSNAVTGAAGRWTDRLLSGAAVCGMALLAAAVLLGVITRAFGDPLIWTDEAARFLMIWTACIGWMTATRRRSHIRIRFFYDKFPAAWRRLLESVIQLAIALFGLLLIWHGAELVRRNLEMEATTIPISMSFIYAPIVLAGLIAAAQAAAAVTQALARRGPTA